MVGLNAITREAWNTAQQTEDTRERIQALSLAKECYSMKLDLLTNAKVEDDAIRFASSFQKPKENIIVYSTSNDQVEKDSNESTYSIYESQLGEEQQPKAGKTNSTVNQVF